MNSGFSRPPPTNSPAAKRDSGALAERLRARLTAQSGLATELEGMLGRERGHLMSRDWDAVLSLSEDKNQLVARLQILANEITELAAGKSLPELLDSLGLGSTQAEMQEQATRLLRANRECRALLDHHQARVGTALRLLNRGPSVGTYGRNGYAGNGRLSQKLAAA